MILSTRNVLDQFLSGAPISLTRCGDGEGIILKSVESVAKYKLASHSVIHRQLGRYIPFEDVEIIRENLISAFTNTNILGIPMHNQRVSSHWDSVQGTLEKYVKELPLFQCSVDVCYDFLKEGYFKPLLEGKQALYYVGCRDLQTQFLKHFNLSEVFPYHITPEKKFTSADTGIEVYPEAVHRIQYWMRCANPSGKLLFVGAGIFGKIFCNWWRDMGGQAFDIGSVMDSWAGMVTRGPLRGLDTYDEDKTYIL